MTFHDPVHVVRLLRGGLLEAWAPVVPLSELDCAGQYNDEWQRATVGDAPAGDAVAEHCSQDLVEWLYQQCGRTGTARCVGLASVTSALVEKLPLRLLDCSARMASPIRWLMGCSPRVQG